MNTTKKLTEAALLSSLFIVSTIFAVGSGFGYALYLDFAVPIFFCIVYLKCDTKYTILSGISSLLIIFLILGNIGTAIWASQSIILGIMCGIFISKDTTILDDIICASILGIILMVFIDIYASALIGYSFMEEFQGYAKMFPFKDYINTVYYLFIATFPLGTVFSIYYLSLLLGKKLRVLKGNATKKLYVINNFKAVGRFMCCSKKVFYSCVIYIFIIQGLELVGIKFNNTYIKTILISIQYLCLYFVIRDSYSSLQNYILSKYQKILYARILSLITLILLIVFFKFTTTILIIIDIVLDKKINIRLKQIDIISAYTSRLIQK